MAKRTGVVGNDLRNPEPMNGSHTRSLDHDVHQLRVTRSGKLVFRTQPGQSIEHSSNDNRYLLV